MSMSKQKQTKQTREMIVGNNEEGSDYWWYITFILSQQKTNRENTLENEKMKGKTNVNKERQK